MNLKRLHHCWREGDNSGKTEIWKLAAEKNLPISSTEVVYRLKLENNLKWLKKLKPGKEAPLENFSSDPICTVMNWRLFLANFSVVFWTKYAWRWEGNLESLGLTNGERFTGLGPVYTGPDEFLHGRILYLDRLFTWDRANSVTDYSSVYMGPCKFWDQSRLCHDWLKLLFSASHVAVDGLRQIQNGDLDKNFTWTDKDINLLLHVVLDYIKKAGEGVD